MFSYIISQKLYIAISGEYKNPHGVTKGRGAGGGQNPRHTQGERDRLALSTLAPLLLMPLY